MLVAVQSDTDYLFAVILSIELKYTKYKTLNLRHRLKTILKRFRLILCSNIRLTYSSKDNFMIDYLLVMEIASTLSLHTFIHSPSIKTLETHTALLPVAQSRFVRQHCRCQAPLFGRGQGVDNRNCSCRVPNRHVLSGPTLIWL